MSKFLTLIRRSYVYMIIALFYVPLLVGVIYSFSAGARRGDMPINFSYTGEGWVEITNDTRITDSFFNTLFIGAIVAIFVVFLGLFTVFGLWRQRNRLAKSYVTVTNNVPLINPDIITGISLAITFAVLFGVLQRGDNDYPRVIAAQVTFILPFAILIMYPRSEKFRITLFEASKDLGYGPIRTWFNTYFRHMLPVIIGAFAIALTLSFDDFIVARVVSRQRYTLGIQMYQSTIKPWVLAFGSIMLFCVLAATGIFSVFILRSERRKKTIRSNRG